MDTRRQSNYHYLWAEPFAQVHWLFRKHCLLFSVKNWIEFFENYFPLRMLDLENKFFDNFWTTLFIIYLCHLRIPPSREKKSKFPLNLVAFWQKSFQILYSQNWYSTTEVLLVQTEHQILHESGVNYWLPWIPFFQKFTLWTVDWNKQTNSIYEFISKFWTIYCQNIY